MLRFVVPFLLAACFVFRASAQPAITPLKISANGRHFETGSGQRFFWLGDTGWLMFKKTTREQALHYLDTRQRQGFNVIQAMLLHELNVSNAYGRNALIGQDISRPEPDRDSDSYWSYVDFVIREAAKRSMYMALVPVWGAAVRKGKITTAQAERYAEFLATRFGGHPNVIWLNGGDIRGSECRDIWETMGATLKKYDPVHLMSFHPRGRYSSSDWFHNASWLDFNMFQSGHRTYAQDTSKGEKHYGEDNWRYVANDYALRPVKPVIDGEPSYENIPHGLHDSTAPRWTDADVRRYAWWSVLSGAAGFTYGENAVMQFHKAGDTDGAYGVNDVWTNTIHSPGAAQMKYLKRAILDGAFAVTAPAPEIVLANPDSGYDHVAVLRNASGAMFYSYTGKPIRIRANRPGLDCRNASWLNPRTGKTQRALCRHRFGKVRFIPPDNEGVAGDWVLEFRPRQVAFPNPRF